MCEKLQSNLRRIVRQQSSSHLVYRNVPASIHYRTRCWCRNNYSTVALSFSSSSSSINCVYPKVTVRSAPRCRAINTNVSQRTRRRSCWRLSQKLVSRSHNLWMRHGNISSSDFPNDEPLSFGSLLSERFSPPLFYSQHYFWSRLRITKSNVKHVTLLHD